MLALICFVSRAQVYPCEVRSYWRCLFAERVLFWAARLAVHRELSRPLSKNTGRVLIRGANGGLRATRRSVNAVFGLCEVQSAVARPVKNPNLSRERRARDESTMQGVSPPGTPPTSPSTVTERKTKTRVISYSKGKEANRRRRGRATPP